MEVWALTWPHQGIDIVVLEPFSVRLSFWALAVKINLLPSGRSLSDCSRFAFWFFVSIPLRSFTPPSQSPWDLQQGSITTAWWSLYSASLWEFCLSFKALVCIKQRIATPKAEEKSPASQSVERRLSVHMEIMVHTSVSPHTVCVYNVPPLVVHTSDESSSVNNKKGKHDW